MHPEDPKQSPFGYFSSIQRLIKYRGAMGMLLIGFMVAMGPLGVVGWNAKGENVQFFLISVVLVGLLGFFVTACWMVSQLGLFAVADGQDLVTLKRLDVAAKGGVDLTGGPQLTNPEKPSQTFITESESND